MGRCFCAVSPYPLLLTSYPPIIMRSIVLTGFMGVGKSTIGWKVAEALTLPFVDLDHRIEAASGHTIPELFEEGEALFRWWEQQTLATLPWESPFVLATGGGALIGARNRALVAEAVVIVLDAPLNTVQARLAADGGRPLATHSAALYERRRALYNRIPLHIETEGRGVDEVVAAVIEMAGMQEPSTATHPLTPSAEGETPPHPPTENENVGRGGYGVAHNATPLTITSAFNPTPTMKPEPPAVDDVKGNDSRFPLPICRTGVAATIGERVAALNPTGVAIITDQTLGRLWGEQVRHDLLAAKLPTTLLEVPAGEAYKTLETVSTLYDRLLEAGLDRGGVVVALGGGVVGDMAGFVAATWMRGVKGLVQMPTTLLAMVDASIGGKTGVDHPKGKNLIGAFRQPDYILADPDFLTTLPLREWRSGLAEVIKHGVIADPALFAMVWDTPPTAPPTPLSMTGDGGETAESRFLMEWLARAIRVKTDIVQRDPFERGERAKLNLGHTFGHAYETLSGFALAHGEAVALGMITAARLSERLGLAQAGLAEEIRGVIAGVGLPTTWHDAPDPETIWQAMQSDKKKAGKGLRLVLPRAIGDVMVTAPGEVAKADVMKVLERIN